MPLPIIIVDYSPEWATEFRKEQARIRGAIGDQVLAIEHIGSTAVPGLGAKPIIDIMVAVEAISNGFDCIDPLESLGYEHVPYPEFPERLFFRNGPMGEGPYHLHITELMSSFWVDKILFRDFLRAHSEAAQEYFRLKKDLALRYGEDGEKYEAYTEAKSPFIKSALERARMESQGV